MKPKAARESTRARALWERARPNAAFLVSFAFLNAVVSLRYPGPDLGAWWLLPAIDTVALLGLFALVGLTGRRVPNALHWLLVALLVCLRLIRIGDGVQRRYFETRFNAYFDVPLLPELARLMGSTLPAWKLALLVIALVVGLCALCIALRSALGVCERYLRAPRHAAVVAALVLPWLLAPAPMEAQHTDLFSVRALGGSALARLGEEIEFAAQASQLSEQHRREIARVQRELAHTPHDLARLEGQHVLLFVIESYGRAAFDQPLLAPQMQAVSGAVEARAAQAGFQIASAWLESPTYGGRSWLAHATLSSAVHTPDQLVYRLLLASKPQTLAHYFRRAGYRAVLAQPGTTRPFQEGDVYGFDAEYYAWHFQYAGPRFSWAPMPDQFVVDFMHRRELERAKSPLFIEYALVSSHAPWDHLPPLVNDWNSIGNGAVYHKLPPVRFDVPWPELSGAATPYMRSIAYDFEVLMRYLAEFVTGDALVIVLGDHQPARQVTQSESHDVPIHVLSRRRVFVDAFASRGYTRGMRPKPGARRTPMRQFLPDLLRTFSSSTQKKG